MTIPNIPGSVPEKRTIRQIALRLRVRFGPRSGQQGARHGCRRSCDEGLARGLAVLAAVIHVEHLTLNVGDCLPLGIYSAHPAPASLARGMIVEFCSPPSNPMIAFGMRRGWFGHGECPGGVMPLIKEVGALPGDTVVVQPTGVTINGKRVPNTRVEVNTLGGAGIPHLPFGNTRIAPGEFWALANYAQGAFDSRYYGTIKQRIITARMTPVLTWWRP